jgi:hypothetical protein
MAFPPICLVDFLGALWFASRRGMLPSIQPSSADGSWLGAARKGTRDFTPPLPVKTASTSLEGDRRMAQDRGQLTPEERAKITELQDTLIEGLEGGRR